MIYNVHSNTCTSLLQFVVGFLMRNIIISLLYLSKQIYFSLDRMLQFKMQKINKNLIRTKEQSVGSQFNEILSTGRAARFYFH